ncbi:MAG: rhodanese-like domain-containing protein [Myxococcota bacterium]
MTLRTRLGWLLPLAALALWACDDGGESGTTTGTYELSIMDQCASAPLAAAEVNLQGGESVTADTQGIARFEDLEPGEYVLTAHASGYIPEQLNVTVEGGEIIADDASLQCQRGAVAERAREFLAGLSEEGAYQPIVSASALFDNFMDGDASNDPTVLSVRGTGHYEQGHVPTAINAPWKTVASDETLALLGEPDPDEHFVDYCYTGHTGGIAAGVLNLLGYPTANMKFGIAAWTKDEAARAEYAVYPDQGNDFMIESEVHEATETFEQPWLEFEDVTDAWEATKAAADAYLNAEVMKPTKTAQDLFDNLNDGNDANDPFIISVRAPDHYAIGHIPGAINIPWKTIADADNLAKIPTDREIVIYCYTGHTGAIATSVLGTLGYHEVRNLKYGFLGWTQDADARVAGPFDPSTDGNDFPVVTGSDPGSF